MAPPSLWITGIRLEHRLGKWGASFRVHDRDGFVRADSIVPNAADVEEAVTRAVSLAHSGKVGWHPDARPELSVPGDGRDPGLPAGWPVDWRDQVRAAAERHQFDCFVEEVAS